MDFRNLCYGALALCLAGCTAEPQDQESRKSISGIYPHLAFYNEEGECGTGAVVPWNGDLWAITYGPHKPFGSTDKLYRISPDKQLTVCAESIGGTPANRMIHKEFGQLNIGPYFIDANSNIRVIPWQQAPGRYTATARHLTDPEHKLYIGTMEEGFYEVDVNTLETVELYKDLNEQNRLKAEDKSYKVTDILPGAHGKGMYSGQGVLVYADNGENTPEAMKFFDAESGSLSEWDGKEWKVIRRNQFVEVTGPGGIYGNENPDTDPVWTTGWDHKSVLLGVREPRKGWTFYRLPKASHSYDGAHGWNTEWPRIRNIAADGETPEYLMTMHGLFWKFPGTFSTSNSAGIRPRTSYLKVIGDFTRWNDELVFGCDDSAQKEFMNKRKAKGNIEGPGQSNSNLWFTSLSKPDELGPATADGAVWIKEDVKAGVPSDPFLFAGWAHRQGWIDNQGDSPVTFTYETDAAGDGSWKVLRKVRLEPGEQTNVIFGKGETGEWIRVKADKDTKASVVFTYTSADNRAADKKMFAGLAEADEDNLLGGLIYGLGDNRRHLGLLATEIVDGEVQETGYYEMGDTFELVRKDDDTTASFIRTRFAIPSDVVTVDEGSVLIIDDRGRRWRLPLGDNRYSELTGQRALRICREVATERDLFSCMGTFYELPAENADGYAKIRPVCTHNFRINDYASYRGMLVMTGIDPAQAGRNEHIVISDDGNAAVWVGAIDDLWKMGKPAGQGGPWKDSEVKAGVPSDPYLTGFYDKKELTLSHKSDVPVTFTVEADPTGCGDWMKWQTVTVNPGKEWEYTFPDGFQARWIRFVSDKDAVATAWLNYM